MKFILITLLALFLVSCGSKETKKDDSPKPNPTDTLDKLLDIKSETELIEKFGKENVTYDTVYGAEGAKSMATLLYPGTKDQVEIVWKRLKKKTDMEKVTLTAFYDEKNDRLITETRWKTSYGITLGTTLQELEKMNEIPFIFYGFGWDFGGIVSEYNKGKLAHLPITLQLGIQDFLNEGNNPDYEMLMGDNEYNSDDPEAQRLNPVVTSISITKKLNTITSENCDE